MLLKDRLLRALPFSAHELDMLIWSAPLRYKSYRIPKRQPGQFRQVSQPTPEVKLLQRWLVLNELSAFKIHKSATAYRYGVGLRANVEPHTKNRFMLKLDFADFFPSIKALHFVAFMRAAERTADDIEVMKQIFFKRDPRTATLQLAIGAPSSPALSNILLFNLDTQLEESARRLSITYTRYADDITFSTNERGVLPEFFRQIPQLIAMHSRIPLQLNPDKTVHASMKNGRRVTGLTITPGGEISVGKDRKKLLRSQIHYYQCGRLDQTQIDSLRGYLAFLLSVEPDHVKRIEASYGRELIQQLLT
jgi:RNA-directed DNA polymerase